VVAEDLLELRNTLAGRALEGNATAMTMNGF
jgi:hypothetical protein